MTIPSSSLIIISPITVFYLVTSFYPCLAHSSKPDVQLSNKFAQFFRVPDFCFQISCPTKKLKIMKKRISTLVLAITALVICSGSVSAQKKFITLGVKAGGNLSSMSGDINKTNYVFKYQAGITADLALTENFYVITGLDFQAKGTKSKTKGSANLKYNPMYLQIPVHAAYKMDIAPNTKFVIEAGPYVAYGIGGKVKGDGKKVNIFGDNKFKRFDFGVGAGVGVELGKIVVKGGYDFGLINIYDVKKDKARNHNAYLTLGYHF